MSVIGQVSTYFWSYRIGKATCMGNDLLEKAHEQLKPCLHLGIVASSFTQSLFSYLAFSNCSTSSTFCMNKLASKVHISTFHACFLLLHVAQLFQQLSSFLPRQSDVSSGAGAAPTQDTLHSFNIFILPRLSFYLLLFKCKGAVGTKGLHTPVKNGKL